MFGKNYKPSKSNTKQNLFALFLIIIVAFIFIMGTYFIYQKKQEVASLDKDTLCPSSPKSNFIVLIDNSDILNDNQKEFIKKHIVSWGESIKQYGQFEIYEIDNANQMASPKISVCNPGNETDVNDLYGNKKMMKSKYKEKFKKPIDHILSNLNSKRTLNTSPIMENVQSIAINTMNLSDIRKPRTIIIISDFMQKVPDLNMYSYLPAFEDFINTNYARSVKSDLKGTEVKLFVLNRKNIRSNADSANILNFWEQWFKYQGATVMITDVPG